MEDRYIELFQEKDGHGKLRFPYENIHSFVTVNRLEEEGSYKKLRISIQHETLQCELAGIELKYLNNINIFASIGSIAKIKETEK